MLFELSYLHSNHMLKDDQHIFMTRTLIRQTGLLNVEPQEMGTSMDWLGLFGILAVVILICVYFFEKALKPLWPGLSKPPTFAHILREWLLYMTLFIGLLALLEGMLRLACSVSC